MDYSILVNKDNPLPRAHIPNNLVDTESKYKDNIKIDKKTKYACDKLKKDAQKYWYYIDIESGYRDYDYQEKIYNKLLEEKGFTSAVTRIAEPGKSEHQTGLAIDFCVYKDDKCYIEHDIKELLETKWVHQNAHRYGFILRYPEGKEDITKYSYEPWHLRYVGELSHFLYNNNLTLEEYYTNKEKHWLFFILMITFKYMNKYSNKENIMEENIIDKVTVKEIKNKLLKEETIIDIAELFKVFGDSTRVKIINVLLENKLCVGDIAHLIKSTPSAVSHQLRILKTAKLVKCKKIGKVVYYEISDEHVKILFNIGEEHINEI